MTAFFQSIYEAKQDCMCDDICFLCLIGKYWHTMLLQILLVY